MMTTIRPELEALPRRMRHLPIDVRGYPVPWFVLWIDGAPEFRIMDRDKWIRAVGERRCWVCGEPLGVHLTFTIGPMCALNRTNAEPPSHHECATYAARNCPFLSRPQMRRRADALTDQCSAPGVPLLRNPGVTGLWTTRHYRVFRAEAGLAGVTPGWLVDIGEPERIEWFAQGRPATRDEVLSAIESGLPFLQASCLDLTSVMEREEARRELTRRRAALEPFLPEPRIDPPVEFSL
jgi:hypothetical protein